MAEKKKAEDEAAAAIEACQEQIDELEKLLKTMKAGWADIKSDDHSPLAGYAEDQGHANWAKELTEVKKMDCFTKQLACAWHPDNTHVASASSSGRLIHWNALVQCKDRYWSIGTWTLDLNYSPSGRLLATGGLDNDIFVVDVPENEETKTPTEPKCRLAKHTAYVCCLQWMTEGQLMSSSGDRSILLWDVANGTVRDKFIGHHRDVSSFVFRHEKPQDEWISASLDKTCRLWDRRVNGAKWVMTFPSHELQVNDVCMMPGENSFVSCSDDGAARLFDLRVGRLVNRYSVGDVEDEESRGEPISKVQVSKTGRAIYCATADGHIDSYDALSADPLKSNQAHDGMVAGLAMSPDGKALASIGYDHLLKIWA